MLLHPPELLGLVEGEDVVERGALGDGHQVLRERTHVFIREAQLGVVQVQGAGQGQV